MLQLISWSMFVPSLWHDQTTTATMEISTLVDHDPLQIAADDMSTTCSQRRNFHLSQPTQRCV
eukprot:759452-Hanusia_phi.AAC.5